MPCHIIRKVFTVALCPKNRKPNNLAAIVGGVKKKERLMVMTNEKGIESLTQTQIF